MTNDEILDVFKDIPSLRNVLIKANNGGFFNLIQEFINKSIYLYMKRFGNVQYANSISEDEFIKQIIDCMAHLIKEDKNCKELFTKITDADEQNAIAAVVSTMMLDYC